MIFDFKFMIWIGEDDFGFVLQLTGFGGDGDGLMEQMSGYPKRVVLQTEDEAVRRLLEDFPSIVWSSDPGLENW